MIQNEQNPIEYFVLLYYLAGNNPNIPDADDTHTIYLFRFKYKGEFGYPRVSQEYVGLRLPHAIASCGGDHLIVAGQGINSEGEPLVITSWLKEDLE